MEVSVIGLGKLGACLAAWISSKGHNVIGVDVNPDVVKAVSDGNAPVQEPGLQDLMDKYPFRATTDAQLAVLETDMTFIIVPTPSKRNGAFSLTYVKEAARHCALAQKRKKKWHLYVVVSTVMPGHMAQIKELMEVISLQICGVDFGLCYNPEFIALGGVLHDMDNPDFVLIGESDKESGKQLEDFYLEIYRNRISKPIGRLGEYLPTFRRMNYINAEIAKLALNCYVTMKISYANMIGELTEAVPGADSDAILGAIGCDGRIGNKYFRAGLGWGGPCFPRDNDALIAWAHGQVPQQDWPYLPYASIRTNQDVLSGIIHLVETWTTPDSIVGILGLAYKPGTHITEESQAWMLAQYLGDRAITYDPLAECTHSLEDVLRLADVVVVMLPLKSFEDLHTYGHVVIDPWRVVKKVGEATKLIQLGRYNE